MVMLSLLSSGMGSLCPTTTLQDERPQEKNDKCSTGKLAYNIQQSQFKETVNFPAKREIMFC